MQRHTQQGQRSSWHIQTSLWPFRQNSQAVYSLCTPYTNFKINVSVVCFCLHTYIGRKSHFTPFKEYEECNKVENIYLSFLLGHSSSQFESEKNISSPRPFSILYQARSSFPQNCFLLKAQHIYGGSCKLPWQSRVGLKLNDNQKLEAGRE